MRIISKFGEKSMFDKFNSAVLVCLWVLVCFDKCSSQDEKYAKNYISWYDFMVNEHSESFIPRSELNFEYYYYYGAYPSRVLVVDKNGGGDSVTVQGAIDMVPQNNTERVKIFVLPGIYREKVRVPSSKPYISFVGNGSSETIISWNNKASDKDINGIQLGTFKSASVAIESDYFCATGITFENTVIAAPGEYGMQAVALRVDGDKAMFYKVRILGTQDTLLDATGSHYFYKCHIQGSVDFIFGRGRSLYQDCVIHSTAKRSGAIAAHHRDSPYDDSGFSFVNCVINGTGKIYLGRAWGDYSRAIYSYCYIDDIINPLGWSDWNQPSRDMTVAFGEYKNTGRGADRGGRVPWSKTLSYEEVRSYLDMNFIRGKEWLRL